MTFLYLGDQDHKALQEKQVTTLQGRELELAVEYWDTSDMSIFARLDALPERVTLIASRHGAIPATHWTARNPGRVRRLVLLHPSLHLNLPYQPAPNPHFVPTLVVCNSKEFIPSADQIGALAGKLFHDYALHITPEPTDLVATLSLLSL
jgi:pimeloyl-ACP methyl ester carboxylesterase